MNVYLKMELKIKIEEKELSDININIKITMIKFQGYCGTNIPGLTNSINEIKALMNIGNKIAQAYRQIIPQGIPKPLKKSPNPLPAVGLLKKGSIFGSFYPSPTGFPSAIDFDIIDI